MVTASQVRGFIGGSSGRLVYARFDSDMQFRREARKLYFIDFSEEGLPEHLLVDCSSSNMEPRNPIFSRDGNWVIYNTRSPDSWGQAGTQRMYIVKVGANATPIDLGDGAQPHWWTKPGSGGEYVVYSPKDFEEGWQALFPSEFIPPIASGGGSTYIMHIDPLTKRPLGGGVELISYFCNGGRSANGRWLFTAGVKPGTYEISPVATAMTAIISMHEFPMSGCNPSVSPDSEENRFRTLHLNEQHRGYWICNATGNCQEIQKNNDGEPFCDLTEWSTHPDFITYVGHHGDRMDTPPFDIYINRVSTGQEMKVLDGNYYWNHLWVESRPYLRSAPGVAPPGAHALRISLNGAAVVVSGASSVAQIRIVDSRGRLAAAGNAASLSARLGPGRYVVTARQRDGDCAATTTVLVGVR